MKFAENYKSYIISLLLSFCGACIGAFLAIRLRAFFIAARNITFPVWILWAGTVLIALTFLLFSGQIICHLKKLAFGGKPIFHIVTAVSLLFCQRFKGIVIERPLDGTGMLPSPAVYAASVIGAGLVLSLFVLYFIFAVSERLPGIKSICSSLKRADIVFMAALFILLNFAAALYCKNSRFIYYWDVAGYWTITQQLAETAERGLLPLLKLVYESVLNLDYNYLIALPWVPLVMLFGSSRYTFISGIVNYALFPLLVLVYLFIKKHCNHPIPAAICAMGSFPMILRTALVGFIDLLGAVLTFATVMLWLNSQKDNRPGRFFLIGFLLGCSVLLRRWYAFFCLSYILALLTDCIVFRKSVVPVIGALAPFVFMLLFFFQPFAVERLLANYSVKYAAYDLGLGYDFYVVFYNFGLLAVIIAFSFGIWLCYKRDLRQRGIFLLLQPVVCFLLFIRVQSHGLQHLLLYVPALICLSASLYSSLMNGIRKRKPAGTVLVLSSLLLIFSPLLPKLHPAQNRSFAAGEVLPSFSYAPPVNKDAEEIVNIIRYLDEKAGTQGRTTGILASSFALNMDMLLNAEQSLNLSRASDVSRSYIAWLGEVDTRDPFPGRLFECGYFLVAEPVQLHLGEENQRCIFLPASELLDCRGIGQAFKPLDETFYLGDGTITVKLYEKVRELTEEEKAALIQEYNTPP